MIKDLNKMIDHTLLKADANKDDIMKLCDEAKEYGFFSVCINPSWVKFAKEYLKDTDVKICTVIGFPLGANSKKIKAEEAMDAIENGADELDMVINIGFLKSKEYLRVKEEIEELAKISHSENKILKVIIETALLTKDEIEKACELAKSANADFVKTSTGFSTQGARAEDVKVMKKSGLFVKASGGIRDFQTAKEMIEAGASRIGASSSIKIMENNN